jgi:hypothetical protein
MLITHAMYGAERRAGIGPGDVLPTAIEKSGTSSSES